MELSRARALITKRNGESNTNVVSLADAARRSLLACRRSTTHRPLLKQLITQRSVDLNLSHSTFTPKRFGPARKHTHPLHHRKESARRNLLVVPHPILDERRRKLVAAPAHLSDQLVPFLRRKALRPGVELLKRHRLPATLGGQFKNDLLLGHLTSRLKRVTHKAIEPMVRHPHIPPPKRRGADQEITVRTPIVGPPRQNEIVRPTIVARARIVFVPASRVTCHRPTEMIIRTETRERVQDALLEPWRRKCPLWNGPDPACSPGSP